MGLHTYQIKFNGRTINVKAKKVTAETIAHRFNDLLRITSFKREHYTDHQGNDQVSTSMALFGKQDVPLADPDGFAQELADFTRDLPETIADDKTGTAGLWLKKAVDLLNKHIPTIDKRRTPEQFAADQEENRKCNEERTREEGERKAKKARDMAAITSQYPGLIPLEKSGKSPWAGGAANMKAELDRAFPGVLFSVKSKSYSMGSSISVNWTDGPTIKEVEEITSKYGTKSFDGMQDLETYVGGVFNDVFGGAGYIHENRTVSPELLREVAATMGLTFDATEWAAFESCAHQDAESADTLTSIRNTAHETSKKPDPATIRTETNQVEPGTSSGVTFRLNEQLHGVEIVFPTKPSQEVLSSLHLHGFRFKRGHQPYWWAKQTLSRIDFAKSLAA